MNLQDSRLLLSALLLLTLAACGGGGGDGNGGERMQLFKIGEAVWAPAETHGGNTSDVAQECQVLQIELQ